jgi:hypothetical protein
VGVWSLHACVTECACQHYQSSTGWGILNTASTLSWVDGVSPVAPALPQALSVQLSGWGVDCPQSIPLVTSYSDCNDQVPALSHMDHILLHCTACSAVLDMDNMPMCQPCQVDVSRLFAAIHKCHAGVGSKGTSTAAGGSPSQRCITPLHTDHHPTGFNGNCQQACLQKATSTAPMHSYKVRLQAECPTHQGLRTQLKYSCVLSTAETALTQPYRVRLRARCQIAGSHQA